ncbi:MAG: tetratricopeptide repeat protein [Candidatus Rokubacteria bacterium]|nr:tetratricopeptide repeat protein [Candidatus Rokubacteria bacterium]
MISHLRARYLWRIGLVIGFTALAWSPATGPAQRASDADPSDLKEVVRLVHEISQLWSQGRYDTAIPLAERAVAILEKALAPEDPTVANGVDVLAKLYGGKGDYGRAEPLLQRALAIREKALGPEHPDVAASLENLAALYQSKGDYRRAEALLQRALAIKEKTLGQEHPDVFASLYNLARLYEAKGAYGRAEPLLQRVLAFREKTLGPEHPNVANTLNDLGLLYKAWGDYGRAEPLLQRSLAISEKAEGPEDPNVAASLVNLAHLYGLKGDDGRAETLYRRALAIREKVRGPEHSDVAASLNDLANLYRARRDYGRAEPLLQRALAIWEKSLWPEHPYVAAGLNSLALLYQEKGDDGRAEALYRRALAISEKVQGPEHVSVTMPLINLAHLYWARGELARAVTLHARANDVHERLIRLVLDMGTEDQKRAYLGTLTGATDATISLHAGFARGDSAALRLALTTVLRRKGRVLDAMADSLAVLRRRLRAEDAALFEQWASSRGEMATLVLKSAQGTTAGPTRHRVAALAAQTEQLEARLSARSAELREHARPVTLEGVQKAIPPDTALVEIVSYRAIDPRAATSGGTASDAPRYVAYVVRDRGQPAWVDLGGREAIDGAVVRLREALSRPDRADVKQLSRALDERLMRPLRPLLGKSRTILLAPDGALNLLPFGALVDETGRYLIERFRFAYLTTGRDLLRLQSRTPHRTAPLVAADPDFDDPMAPVVASATTAGSGGEPRRSSDLGAVRFGRLPGTAGEAAALARLLPGATALTGSAATETALKRVQGPSIVHVATHGFFLADQAEGSGASSRDIGVGAEEVSPSPAGWAENPLLRSGLALAGANRLQSGDEDGILTALEVAGLDLWGTKLVVLSACETGVGAATTGEGVYGLRRALVIAGAESQVLSLWKVADEATRDLMIAFYRRLLAGEGRAEALRQAQLEMLRSADRNHPFFWSSFIAGGDWRPIDAPVAPAGVR